MKKIHRSEDDMVLDLLKNTYPNYSLCSYENLGRINGDFKISNKSRFWNDRSRDVLSAIHDINVTLHRYPESYREKIILSNHFMRLFDSQIFPFLENQIKDMKNPEPKYTETMIQLCSQFMRIGLMGMLQSMPSDFIHILEPKIQEVFTLMNAIHQYAERIAPSYAKSTDFPFNLYVKEAKKQKKNIRKVVK